MSLLTKFCPEYSETQLRERLSSLMGKPDEQIPCEEVVRDALKLMDPAERRPFEALSEHMEERHRSDLIMARLKADNRKDMEDATPDVVKNLRPDDIPQHAYLVYMPLTSSFAAYWPSDGKKPLNTSKTYGGKVTATQALQHCVNWFYSHYYKNGGAPWHRQTEQRHFRVLSRPKP